MLYINPRSPTKTSLAVFDHRAVVDHTCPFCTHTVPSDKDDTEILSVALIRPGTVSKLLTCGCWATSTSIQQWINKISLNKSEFVQYIFWVNTAIYMFCSSDGMHADCIYAYIQYLWRQVKDTHKNTTMHARIPLTCMYTIYVRMNHTLRKRILYHIARYTCGNAHFLRYRYTYLEARNFRCRRSIYVLLRTSIHPYVDCRDIQQSRLASVVHLVWRYIQMCVVKMTRKSYHNLSWSSRRARTWASSCVCGLSVKGDPLE
jgi:hypothetical protein